MEGARDPATSENAKKKALTPASGTASMHLMQRVLSLLLAFTFLQTQSWALSGGPNYGGAGQSIIGTYAGVLLPDLEAAALTGGLVQLDQNALGLFAIGIPSSGF